MTKNLISEMANILIPVYGLDWHLYKSPAESEVLDNPLRPYIEFEHLGWNGDRLPFLLNEKLKDSPIVFFHLPPPKELLINPNARIVWIPMWDLSNSYDMSWWKSLPKNLRIVAFSEQVKTRSQAVGLQTLSLRYYKNPEELNLANLDEKRILYYWNRVGILGPEFLYNFCEALHIDEMIFRPDIDPPVDARFEFFLPPKLGKTTVRVIPGISSLSHAEYLKILGEVNIMIAPRPLEGVGVSFIEALARGCVVFSLDAPTMNEYIQHGINGYLFQNPRRTWLSILQLRVRRKINQIKSRFFLKKKYVDFLISPTQDWPGISELDLQALSVRARQDHLNGYREWQNSIPQYADFILNW